MKPLYADTFLLFHPLKNSKGIKYFLLAAAVLLLFCPAMIQAQTPGCIDGNAFYNGSLEATASGSTTTAATIPGWLQTSETRKWYRSGTGRAGMPAIVSTFATGETTTAYLYQDIARDAALDGDSLTLIVVASTNAFSGTNTGKLGVFWKPAGAAFNATSHKVAEIQWTSATDGAVIGFNGAIATGNGLGYRQVALKVRIPNPGSVRGQLRLRGEASAGNTGSLFLYSAYMPKAETCAPSEQLPFDCSTGYAYISQSLDAGSHAFSVEGRTGLYKVDPLTGRIIPEGRLINEDSSDFVQFNALGYNIMDNYLYAYRAGTDQIVRIGADGSTAFYRFSGLKGNYGAGDISKDGTYYLYGSYSSPRTIERIDLNTMTRLPSIPVSNINPFALDIAVNPLDDMIYTISKKGTTVAGPTHYVQKIDPADGTVTDLYTATFTDSTNVFGALFFDHEGNLYGSMNGTGEIWKFPTNTTVDNSQFYVTPGPVTSSNDGARCPIKLRLLNISGKVWHDKDENAVWNGINEPGFNPGNVYANLVDEAGRVVRSNPSDGSYSFPNVSSVGIYSVILTNGHLLAGTYLSASEPLPTGWHHTGTNFLNVPNTTNHSGTITRFTTTGEDVTGLDFGINDPSLLPVSLISFDAYKAGNVVILKWATASELNNEGYSIERSADGSIWEEIAFVSSLSANGNSSERLD